ncbi:MAG: phospho-2-dehydro-3-deoxyheptonate aldolase [Verrucomicrobiaceae bacterium]|nr:phospho-2-dehydro-3-deoxyheptonate aldolase [Verrucomicrobiaceae bacterium]
MIRTTDLHVSANTALPEPAAMRQEIAASEADAALVKDSRETIAKVLSGEDKRFLLIVGPCSIHDLKSGREYAERLAALSRELSDKVLIVMRVYFEKPRTTVGWKGLIMDPHLDSTNDIPTGLRLARTFLREVLSLGLPTATEMLDPITPQYIADLTCWSAIGARTTESQTHRQMASGLSMPVGFKNTTSGAVLPAINGIKAAMQPQTFLGVNDEGRASMVNTTGNPDCHLILRGGEDGPNHDAASVGGALAGLGKNGLTPTLMVDASHANCGKDYRRMPATYREILAQRLAGTHGIIGAMIESHLVAGAQAMTASPEALVYGQSITDQCIDWATTETLLRETAGQMP